MSEPDYRALCAELADAVRRNGDSIAGSYWLLKKVDAALVAEPQRLTDDELLCMAAQAFDYYNTDLRDPDIHHITTDAEGVLAFARAVLAWRGPVDFPPAAH